MKSLLSSFANDFNRTIEVYPKVETKNKMWEVESSWPTASETWIKCLLLINSFNTNKWIKTQINYIQTSHKIRMEFWPTISIWDRIKDWEKTYEVKFVSTTPGFSGADDHLLVLVDEIWPKLQ